jgi:hypothetical protein
MMAMRISDLTDRSAVIAAMEEYDRLGQSAFLANYGFDPSRVYVVEHDGRRYDSKPIAAVAYGIQHTDRNTPRARDFSGGDDTVVPTLERLGFSVLDVRAGPAIPGWAIDPGERLRRVEIHDRYGGGRQGGIAGSRISPNVLVFSDPASGEQHGYFDRWETDNEFHYAGEGQRGDQTLDRGNEAILRHRDQGRALRMFWGSKGTVEYAGEFEVDADDPYYWVDAPETDDGPLRQVIMFRLHPVGTAAIVDPARPSRRTVQPRLVTSYRSVDPAKASAPRDPFEVDPDAVDRGLRGHAETQERLAEFARAHGLEPLSPGAGDPNFDLAWKTADRITVVEVKSLTGANESGQIRLGLGQVLDYQHRLDRSGADVQPVLAVECQPIDTRWKELAERHGVHLVWPETFPTIFDSSS